MHTCLDMGMSIKSGLIEIKTKQDALKFLEDAKLSKLDKGTMQIIVTTDGVVIILSRGSSSAYLIPNDRIIDPYSKNIKDNQKMIAWMIKNIIKYGDRL